MEYSPGNMVEDGPPYMWVVESALSPKTAKKNEALASPFISWEGTFKYFVHSVAETFAFPVQMGKFYVQAAMRSKSSKKPKTTVIPCAPKIYYSLSRLTIELSSKKTKNDIVIPCVLNISVYHD